MFEFHGWATIRDSAGCEDESDDPKPSTVEAVGGLARSTSDVNLTVDARWANGALHVQLAGFRNHRDDSVLDVFERVAAVAPGSYGVLYVLDDEDRERSNEWTRYVMRRGVVYAETDRSLSPHVGLVEDDCSGRA